MNKRNENIKLNSKKQNLALDFRKILYPAQLLNPHRGLPSGCSPFGTHSTSN